MKEKTLTEKEAYEKALEEKPPVRITELLDQPGEVVFKELSDADKFQLLTRYFNDNNTMMRSVTALVSQLYLVVRAIAEKEGIDVISYLREIEKKAMIKEEAEIKKQFDELNKN